MFKRSIIVSVLTICLVTPFLMYAKSKLKVGDAAPDFTLQGDDNKMYTLSDYKHEKVVLFFYPRDYSPNCTAQACSLNKSHKTYNDHNITVFGINYQSPKHHAQFKEEHHLQFKLLSDVDKKVATAYGAHKGLLTAIAPKRRTILIDQGKIVAILDDIDVSHHDNQILKIFADRGLLAKNQ